MKMTLKIGRNFRAEVADFAEASQVYSQMRDASGEGASTFPNGELPGHYVSYNGRVWAGVQSDWKPGAVPVYKPEEGFNQEQQVFLQGLADRMAGKPMMAFGDDRDESPELVDAYGVGYDPRDEMGLVAEGSEQAAADMVKRLCAETGTVIPASLPYNACEFSRDEGA